MIDLNVKALHYLTKGAAKIMDRQGYGYILNVASSAGLIPAGPYMATYYATKAYVTSLSRAVAEEFKQKNSRVYIGCLCPGPVDTEFNDVANVKFSIVLCKLCNRYDEKAQDRNSSNLENEAGCDHWQIYFPASVYKNRFSSAKKEN